ncbi:trypsin-like peptidase domain-containing protein [Streptomyces melanogenes]|uniref:Trypsin-like peptidase domain-containing protein n=1 Tax=Streptomyces melanogenes TaxID=67326 RepID=A0ABZ1XBW1_9ACTN|nr:trypsin-like peptidase domain-containing protein [Streptomyces melanogenes]
MESLVTSSAEGDPVAAKPLELGGPAAAVAQILTGAGVATGAGFLVPGGVVVTCAHVVCDAGHGPGDEVEVRFPQAMGAPKARGRVLTGPWRRPEDEDTAVIQLAQAPPLVPELLVGLAHGAKGRPAWSFGFPSSTFDGGHEGTATVGGPLRVLDHWVLQLHDANTVARGFSGAPVVDTRTGLVIGMVTSLPGADPHQRGLNTAYATPGEILREVWPALKPLDVCPYQDFRAFTYERARWFHGRDRAKEQLLRHLVGRRHGVLLQGPSGSGKSSLVQAGVLPELPSGWRSVVARPARGLRANLELAGLPGAADGGILASAERFLAESSGTDHLLLVIDQFEELLTSPGPGHGSAVPDEDLIVLRQLTEVVESRAAVTVLLVMRNDFYPRLADRAPKLLQAVQPVVDLPPTLTSEELYAIITKPAADAALRFEEGLPQTILTEVLASGRYDTDPDEVRATVLPLLEKTLTLVWENRADNLLTCDAYAKVGRFGGSLAQWQDAVLGQLDERHKPVAQRVLALLVRHDRSGKSLDTRRQRSVAELRTLACGPAVDEVAVDRVLTVLTRERIITVRSSDESGGTGPPMAELVHDLLIDNWPELRQWGAAYAEFDMWLDHALERAGRWEGSGKGGDLLQGTDLELGRRWRAEFGLPAPAEDFLSRSERRRRWRRLQVAAVGVSAVCVAALAATGVIRVGADGGAGRSGNPVASASAYPATDAGARALMTMAGKGADPGLVEALRPRHEDYEAVFQPGFAKQAERFYQASAPWPSGPWAEPQQTVLQMWKATTEEIHAGTAPTLKYFPGGYAKLKDGFRPGLVIYRWKYTEPGEPYGMALDGLVFVNGHWALFPKPWLALGP